MRAGHFTGGGHIFAKVPRSFELKVNRKAQRAAFRSALAEHVEAGTFALLDTSDFGAPSTKQAAALIAASGLSEPLVVVLTDDELVAAKSFRNLERVAVVPPSELEVGAVVWARSLLVSEAALPRPRGAGALMHAGQIRARPDRLGEELPRQRQRDVHLPGARRRAQDADPPGRRRSSSR